MRHAPSRTACLYSETMGACPSGKPRCSAAARIDRSAFVPKPRLALTLGHLTEFAAQFLAQLHEHAQAVSGRQREGTAQRHLPLLIMALAGARLGHGP